MSVHTLNNATPKISAHSSDNTKCIRSIYYRDNIPKEELIRDVVDRSWKDKFLLKEPIPFFLEGDDYLRGQLSSITYQGVVKIEKIYVIRKTTLSIIVINL
jgi:hypothetical protein